jgi:hypothetical protein
MAALSFPARQVANGGGELVAASREPAFAANLFEGHGDKPCPSPFTPHLLWREIVRFGRGCCIECAGLCTFRLARFLSGSRLARGPQTKWLFPRDLPQNRPGTGDSEDLAAQMLLCLVLKEAVPKHDLYSHPLYSTLHDKPFRLAERSHASPFLNPITHASFECGSSNGAIFLLGPMKITGRAPATIPWAHLH